MEKEQTIKVHEVKEAPFAIIEHESKFMVVMGNNQVSPEFDSKEKAEKYIGKRPWRLIIAIIGIICEKVLTDLMTKNSKN